MILKDPEYRNRKFLDLAHRDDAECGNCDAYGPCDPAHSNQSTHGKGGSHKAHDVFAAHLCRHCHRWLDQGGKEMDPTGRFEGTREGKVEMWTRAFHRTLLRLFRQGKLKVA